MLGIRCRLRHGAFRFNLISGVVAAGVISLVSVGYVFLNKVDYNEVYQQGLKAARLGNVRRLQECRETLAASQDFFPHSQILLGFEHRSHGRFDEALVSFSKGQKDIATREVSFLQAGLICYELKEYREAIQLLGKVVKWNPDDLMAHRMLAAAFYDIGAMNQSLDEIAAVIRLAPEDYRPHYMKAEILKDYEQFQVAASAFEAGAELAPSGSEGEHDVRTGWSECLLRLGRHEEALAALQPLQLSPVVAVRRAEAYYFLRKYEISRRLLEPVLPDRIFDVDAVTLAVRLYEQEENYSAGMRLIQEALDVQPKNVRLLSSAADVFGAGGQREQATEFRELAAELAELQQEFSELHQAAVQDLDDAGLRVRLAEIAVRLGKPKIARTWLEAAVGMEPQNEEVQNSWRQFRENHPEVFSESASTSTGDDP